MDPVEQFPHVHVRANLDVDRHQIGPRLAERLDEAVRVGDHQVHVQSQIGDPPDRLDDRDPDAQVGYEVAVHHVQVEHPGARLLQPTDLPLQIAEIARQQRRSDQRNGGVKVGQ